MYGRIAFKFVLLYKRKDNLIDKQVILKEKSDKQALIITVKTLYGLEEALIEELAEFGYDKVEKRNRAVQLSGTWKDVYFLNLHLRCALTVLVEIKKFRIKTEEDLYKTCKKIDWTSYFFRYNLCTRFFHE